MTENTPLSQFIEVFQSTVKEELGTVLRGAESSLVQSWLTRVCFTNKWYGQRDVPELLVSWDQVSPDNNDPLIVDLFNRMMTIVSIRCLAKNIDIDQCLYDIARTVMNIYPKPAEDAKYVKYDLALENHIDDDVIRKIIVENRWFGFLIALQVISLNDFLEIK